MKFEEAIKVNGKATLGCGGYVEFNSDDVLVDNNGVQQKMARSYLDDDDWEVYEEPKKTLSDKITIPPLDGYYTVDLLKVKDVKEALNNILTRCDRDVLIQRPGKEIINHVISIIKQEVGGDLVD